MKTILIAIFPACESWVDVTVKLKQIFARMTGYDLMLEGSRNDLKLVAQKDK